MIDLSTCPICAELGDYFEIANPQDLTGDDTVQVFPDAIDQLLAPNEYLDDFYRYESQRLLKCSACGAYYWYREWSPGGSEDVLHTTIHESVVRLSLLEVHVELDQVRRQAVRRALDLGQSAQIARRRVAAALRAEFAGLRARPVEVIAGAVLALESRHRGSEDIALALAQYPEDSRTRVIDAFRKREEDVAASHAAVLAGYMGFAGADQIPPGLLSRLAALSNDANPRVRAAVSRALARLTGS